MPYVKPSSQSGDPDNYFPDSEIATVIEGLGDGVVVADMDGEIVLANEAARRYLCLHSQQLNQAWSDRCRIYRTDRVSLFPEYELPLILALEGVASRDVEMFIVDIDERINAGTTVSVSGKPIYANGRQIGGAITLRDIDLEFSNRQKLAHQTQLMIRMFDAMPFPAFFKDAQLKYQLCNAAFARNAGYSSADRLIGKTDLELKWDRDEARRYHTSDKHVLFSRASTINASITFSDRSGRQKYFMQSKIPLVSDRDETLGLFGIYVDVTAVRELESELQSARKLESVGQLAAGIAHEINTPTQFTRDNIAYLADVTSDLFEMCESLQSIVANGRQSGPDTVTIDVIAELLQKADVEYAMGEVPLALEQAREGTTRISEIVSAMKEFSHPGKEKAFVDLNKAITTSCTVARNEWKYCANVHYDFDEELPEIECCQGEINQVIVNLVVNAAHAIAAKNEGQATLGTICISTQRQGNFVIIEIADDGIGMTEKTKNRVFEPFFTTKEAGKGTGQGMTIAYDVVVNKHSGKLTVNSVFGEGTTVCIQIPIEAPPR